MEEEARDVFSRRWSLTTNHEPSRDPNYMRMFRNTTSSALHKSQASPKALKSDMLYSSKVSFCRYDAPSDLACQQNQTTTFMRQLFEGVSAFALQKWRQFLQNVNSAN